MFGTALQSDDDPFWIVANFKSNHWKMCDTNRFQSEREAVAYAKELCGRHPHHNYHVLKTTKHVRLASPPIEVVDLSE